MAVQGASSSTGSMSGTAQALHVVLWLLAVLVFAQAVFAGLFLDRNAAWRDWHATNGMLLLPLLALVEVVLAVLVWRPGGGPGWIALASVGLLLAIFIQIAIGQTSQLAVHVPLGVAILGLTGALLGRTRNPDPSLHRPVGIPGTWSIWQPWLTLAGGACGVALTAKQGQRGVGGRRDMAVIRNSFDRLGGCDEW
jgi:hypothetical protein